MPIATPSGPVADASGRPSGPLIGVTGSTGRVGSRVAEQLAASGARLRLIVRDPTRAPQLPGASLAVADYADAVAAEAALDGVDVLFMVSAVEHPDRVTQHVTFVRAAAASGVRHIVYTSFYGAAPDATFTFARDHFATEQEIRASGMAFTFLRDNLYLDLIAHFAGDDGAMRGPAGDGRLAAVAIDDVADVAVAVLRDPATHEGQTLDLCGPDDLDLSTIAAAVTEITGRPTRYVPETEAEAYASRAIYDAPAWQVEAWVSTYLAIAAGELAGPTDAVERVTGHPPRSLRDVLRAESA